MGDTKILNHIFPKNTLQRKNSVINSQVVLLKPNMMLPIMKPIPAMKSFVAYTIPKSKSKIVHAYKQKKKPISLLWVPSNTEHKYVEKPKNCKFNDQKLKPQQISPHIKSKTTTSINDYELPVLLQKKDKYTAFPNPLSVSPTYNLQEKQGEKPKKRKLCTNKFDYCTKNQDTKNNDKQVSNESIVNKYEKKRTKRKNISDKRHTTKRTPIAFLNQKTMSSKSTPINLTKRVCLYDPLALEKNFCTENDDNENMITKKEFHPSHSENTMNTINYESDMSLNISRSTFYQLASSVKRVQNLVSINDNKIVDLIKTNYDTKFDLDKHITENNCRNQSSSEFGIKYSWENIDWTPKRIKDASTNIINSGINEDLDEKTVECKVKYSWQVLGTSSQTSQILLQDLLKENHHLHDSTEDQSTYKCGVKYSWQIIGTGTQVTLENYDDNYWSGVLIASNIHSNKKDLSKQIQKQNDKLKPINQEWKRKFKILSNQYTQTFSNKENQTDFTDCRVKYSWENLILQHL